MDFTRLLAGPVVAAMLAFAPGVHAATDVVITPLGSHDGEFCAADRAMIFEDPDGTRILYDAGRTVRGADDPRLGRIDAVLLSHAHGDHLGDQHAATANNGTCARPEYGVMDAPNSNTVNIVVAKKAKLLVGGEMNAFFQQKLRSLNADPTLVVTLRFGASSKIGGVTISSVPAVHSNGVDPSFLTGDLAMSMKANGLTADLGPAGGYVVQFTNGLVVYLSGDTGVTADQELVVRRLYKPQLAVLNIGGTFTVGPKEAAYVIDDLVKPKAVIPSHANEASTQDGKPVAGSRLEAFGKAVHVPVYLPLSGKSMTIDGQGKCVAGC